MATLRYSHLWNIFTPTGKLLLWVIFVHCVTSVNLELCGHLREKKKCYQILAGTTHHEIKMHWRQICRKTVISIYLPNIFQWFLYYLVFKGSLRLNSDTFRFFPNNYKCEQLVYKLMMRILETRNYEVHFAKYYVLSFKCSELGWITLSLHKQQSQHVHTYIYWQVWHWGGPCLLTGI